MLSFASSFYASKASFEFRGKTSHKQNRLSRAREPSAILCERACEWKVEQWRKHRRMTTHNRPRDGWDKMNMIKCKRFRKAKWRNTENQLSFWKIVPLIVKWTESIGKGRWAMTSADFGCLSDTYMTFDLSACRVSTKLRWFPTPIVIHALPYQTSSHSSLSYAIFNRFVSI